MDRTLTVATRRSTLALAQTRAFVRSLVERHPGLRVEELHVVTEGDRIQDRPLYQVGGKGLFVKEIEEALLDRRADFAVHSMKDLPARQPSRLGIACMPQRADPRDAILFRPGVAATFSALGPNARIGSSSLRRAIMLRGQRDDLHIEPLRGNIDTRIRKLNQGDYDAIVLAAAGLSRLGVDPSSLPPIEFFSTETMLPAVAQGILAIEARDDDDEVRAILAALTHRPTELRASVERGVLRALDADCTVPLAAHATFVGDPDDGTVHVDAWLANPEGTRTVRTAQTRAMSSAQEGEALGLEVGSELMRKLAALEHTP